MEQKDIMLFDSNKSCSAYGSVLVMLAQTGKTVVIHPFYAQKVVAEILDEYGIDYAFV